MAKNLGPVSKPIDAVSLRKTAEYVHHEALNNILNKCNEAAGKGYIMLQLDPLSEALTTALRAKGLTVNDQLVSAQGVVRIFWR